MASKSGTVEAVLAVLGGFFTLQQLVKAFPPPPGPRLRPGELRGAEASGRAARAYWDAETATLHGKCSIAKKRFAEAESYRLMAEDRAERGDQTVKDVRGSQRIARAALAQCKNGTDLLEGLESKPKRRVSRR